MQATNCPPAEALRSLVLGLLSETESAPLELHLFTCNACLQRLRTLDQQDAFADALKNSADSLEHAAVSERIDSLVRRLLELGPVPPEGSTHNALGNTQWGAKPSYVTPVTDPASAEAAPSINSEPLSHLGPYELLEKIGEGGMGAVYKARHTKLKKLVALKVLPQSATRNLEAIARFEREMEAVGRLEHPNIVRAMDAGEYLGTHYLVMEYVEGQDLQQLIKQSGPLSVSDACTIIRQAALALAHAHENGLIHRDIKPSNLYVTRQGLVKILDLGLARLGQEEASAGLTSTGVTLGTPDFMAPEQWADTHSVDARCDLYALGCTLYFLLTGHAPFADDKHRSVVSKLTGHVNEAIPSLRKVRPDIPLDLERIYLRLLAKKPVERLSSAADLGRSLEAFCTPGITGESAIQSGIAKDGERSRVSANGLPIATHLTPKFRLGANKHRGIAVIVGLIGVFGIGILGFWATNRPPQVADLGPAIASNDQTPQSKSSHIRFAPDQTFPIPANCLCLAVSPDNRRIAIGCEDRYAHLIDLESHSIVHTFAKHDTRVLSIDFSPDGTLLATGEDSKQMHLWNVETGERVHSFPTVAASWSIKFSPNGRQLVGAGGADLWDLENYQSASHLDGRKIFGTSVAFVPEANELATVEYFDGSVLLIDQLTGKVKQRIATLGKGTRSVAISPDGTRLAVAHGDGPEQAGPQVVQEFAVYVFDRATGNTLARLGGQRAIPWSVAFDPLGEWLACTSIDGVIRLWHAESLEPGPPLQDMPGDVRGVAFSKDGSKLIAASRDGIMSCWSLLRSSENGGPAIAVAPFDEKQAKAHQEAWAKHLGVPVDYSNSIGMKFRLIPPGEFGMGGTPTDIAEALSLAGQDKRWQECIKSEIPQHKVLLSRPMYLGVHEVTQAQYKRVVGKNPSFYSLTGKGKALIAEVDADSHPVEMVSWNDAVEFCAKLNQQEEFQPVSEVGGAVAELAETGYRLPTEAEWEFACRAGTTTHYWIGDKEQDVLQAGWLKVNSGGRSHPVGKLKANPFGLFDMHVNVWEWVQDSWEPTYFQQIAKIPAQDPSGPYPGGSHRVLRGGSWMNHAAHCRSSSRNEFHATDRFEDIGFRVALGIDAVKHAVANLRPSSPKP